ncbi:MAG: ABC transporter substrate-binding protein [Actinobacteria bacterium]|nr:ABC transporter substrate-binding protein [Actinomycetota bacterium]
MHASRTRRSLRMLAGVAGLALLMTACGGDDDAADDDGTAAPTAPDTGDGTATDGGDGGGDLPDSISIGALDSLSGAAAFCGQNEVAGMELAIAEAEEMDFLEGTDIELVVEDDASTAEEGVAAYRRLVDSGVTAIVGPCFSTVAQATVDFTAQDEVPMILTTSGDPPLVDPEWVYRAGVTQGSFAGKTVDVLAERGIESIAVIYHTDTPTIVGVWEEVWKPGLEAAGIELVSEDGVTADKQDFSAEIAKYQQLDPDAIGVLVVGGPNVAIVTQLREAGLDQPIMGQLVMGAPFYIENAGAAANGSIFATNFHHELPFESSQAFTEAYRAAEGSDPDFAAANGYDGAWMLLHAIKNAGSVEAGDLKLALDTHPGFAGAQGEITFDEKGDAIGPGAVVEIVDQSIEFVSTEG